MIKAAFQPKYWNSDRIVTFPNGVMTIGNPGIPQTTDEFTQMEANFSLFFGLAIQMYEATLVSNDTPFDRFQEGDATLSRRNSREDSISSLRMANALNAMAALLTPYSQAARSPARRGGAERMVMGDLKEGFYDSGFYNIGVTLNTAHYLPNGDTATDETYDIGRGGTDPFGNPLSNARLGFSEGAVHSQSCAVHSRPGIRTLRGNDRSLRSAAPAISGGWMWMGPLRHRGCATWSSPVPIFTTVSAQPCRM